MPKQKDLKRVVRARMEKTGESYTAARAHVIKTKTAPDYARSAGTSEDTILAKTGRSWVEWVSILDTFGATKKTHGESARHVASMGVSGWWSQSVTVGYERIRGLRAIGQRLSGKWEASKSRTFPVPVEKLFDAFAKPRIRARWLAGVKLTVRKATPPKSILITWNDGTSVQGWFMAKGDKKSTVAIQHTKLESKAEVTAMKSYWTGRLDALAEILG